MSGWPEPVVRVQSLSESGITCIPESYVKPINDRPSTTQLEDNNNNIPVIDLGKLQYSLDEISVACREWGIFQVVNHGVREDLMAETRRVWREFFHLPLETKQAYANNPTTYEGYGSRLGVHKGAKLDWSDYFFLHFHRRPPGLASDDDGQFKCPSHPHSCRELVREYSEEVVKLCGRLMKIFSLNLGLEEDYLENAFGGAEQSLRVNFYPKCPQPDLTLGLSPHSDPGGITVLLPDDHVSGLQVRKDNAWLTVKPIPNAFIINLADQLQVVSNGQYKSVEHRVIVNSKEDRLSLAFFYNPRGDIVIRPAEQLLLLIDNQNKAPLYPTPMTFNQYRTFIRLNGLHGKSQVDSLKSKSAQ